MGLQQGANYVLQGPDGHQAAFNDEAHAAFVGYLTEPPAGLDSPDVRGATNSISQGDGGYHGSHFYGPRPITLTGVIPPNTTLTVANARIERLQRASSALAGDATLFWNEEGGGTRFVPKIRRDQPLRIAGTRPKTFQVQLISASHLIESSPSNYNGTSPTALAVTNGGNAPSRPFITWTLGAAVATSAVFTNGVDSLKMLPGTTLTGTVVLSMENRTLTDSAGTVDKYGSIDFTNSVWWGLAPGATNVSITSSASTAAPFTVAVKSTWA